MKAIFFSLVFAALSAAAQDADILLQKNLTLKALSLEKVMAKTESNIKVFADNFEVRLDRKSKIVTPKQVIGPILQPVYKVSVQKCVFLFCQTIDLDAEFSLKRLTGKCSYNYQLSVDLQRSTEMLSDLYSFINTDICIQKTAGGATATLQVNLVHASTYDTGAVQKNAFELISLQGQSILDSFVTTMKLNGVSEILIKPLE